MSKSLFWFRRDLRITDNHGLYQALAKSKVIPCFILDCNILDQLEADDTRIDFILQSLVELKKQFNKYNSDLLVFYGDPGEIILNLAKEYKVDGVYTNEDYEPYAISRDKQLATLLNDNHIEFHLFKDHVIFAKDEILNKSNRPYTIYTPYKNAWIWALEQVPDALNSFPSENLLSNLYRLPKAELPNTKFIGKSFLSGGESAAFKRLDQFIKFIDNYHEIRNFPAITQTSRLGVDLRFGTLSIRQLVKFAMVAAMNEGRKTWLNELIWREFFSQILYNFPYVVDKPFNIKYNNIRYLNNESWFKRWCEGNTGYPIVDAGMRELNQTGFMHNRVRMITASFLCKDLLLDWRLGEKYFAKKLLDYDLASNNGNWQWAASTGCDAQPYFRIFNPMLQAQKFDPDGNYIKKYIPELKSLTGAIIHNLDKLKNSIINNEIKYYLPIVDHRQQSLLAKKMFELN